jgi:WD40 repeat protein
VILALSLLLRPSVSAGEEKKGDERRRREAALIEKITPAIVIIHAAKDKATEKGTRTRSGLGVIVDPRGIVVMPRRLLTGFAAVEVVLSDGRKVTPKTVFADLNADVGIIQLASDKPFPSARFGDSDQVKVGDFVWSFDLAFHREMALERGIISGKRREANKSEERLFMDSARSYPSDRDLLFDTEGNLIGVWTQTGAVPSNCVQEAVRQFLSKKERKSPAAGEQVGRVRHLATLKSPAERGRPSALVRVLGFSPDGKQILTSTLEDGNFRWWDARGGKPSRRSEENEQMLETHWLASIGRSWPFLCEHFLFGYRSISELNLYPTRKLLRHAHLPGFFTCSADGKRLLLIKKENKKPVLVVRDIRNKKTLREFLWKEGDTVSASLSPDGEMVAAAEKEMVSFLDLASGKERRYDFASGKDGDILRTTCVKFAPDGSRVVVVGNQGTLRIVSVPEGRLLAAIQQGIVEPGVQGITGVAFSADGKTLATGGAFDSLLVWEVSTGQLIRHHRGDSLLFSPDNHLIAILSRDALYLHDLYSGERLWEHKEPNGFVESFAFSPDGRLLAAACRDATVRVWDVGSGEKSAKPQPLDVKSLERLWSDLEECAAADPRVEEWRENPGSLWKDLAKGKSARAYEAIGKLIADPERSLPFLKKRLQAAPPVDAERLGRLIADLDSEEFDKREEASRELSKLGEAADAALRTALSRKPSLEMRKRLENLLRELEQKQKRLTMARLRAIQVLEGIGTKDAQALLKDLVEGTGGVSGMGDAGAALRRIQVRSAK